MPHFQTITRPLLPNNRVRQTTTLNRIRLCSIYQTAFEFYTRAGSTEKRPSSVIDGVQLYDTFTLRRDERKSSALLLCRWQT